MARRPFRLELYLFHTHMLYSEHWEVEVAEAGDGRMRTRAGQEAWRDWHPMPDSWVQALAPLFDAAFANPALGDEKNPVVCDGEALHMTLHAHDTAAPVQQFVQLLDGQGRTGRAPMVKLAQFIAATAWPDAVPVPRHGTPTLAHAPAALMAAFQRAIYRVWTPSGTFDLRAGEAHPGLAALMMEHGVTSAALLTACNPMGLPATDAFNQSAMAQLADALKEKGRPVLAAEADDDEGQWREPSLLVLGLDSYEANGLAHHFLQAAWLGITADGTPSVHSCVYYRHGSGLGPTWPPRDDDATHA